MCLWIILVHFIVGDKIKEIMVSCGNLLRNQTVSISVQLICSGGGRHV